MNALLRLGLDASRVRIAFTVGLLLGLGLPDGLAGQSRDSSTHTGPPPLFQALEVWMEGGVAYMGNFFRAPDGEPQQSVRAATGGLRLVQPFGSDAEAFARLRGTAYSEFDPSGDFRVGARWSPRPHSLRGSVGYRWRMPRLDVGDTLAIADVLHLGADYAVRPASFIQLEALADYYDQAHSRRPERANTFLDLGGALRYRGLGYLFSPEVGAAFGTRDVVADADDFDQRSFWITLRSIPSPPLYISLRYRNRSREYTVADAGVSNFGREDRRHQITLTTALALREDLRWTLYYSFEHATSTNARRNFDTHYLWTGFRYRVAGGAGR